MIINTEEHPMPEEFFGSGYPESKYILKEILIGNEETNKSQITHTSADIPTCESVCYGIEGNKRISKIIQFELKRSRAVIQFCPSCLEKWIGKEKTKQAIQEARILSS